jgi:hypothetical protein
MKSTIQICLELKDLNDLREIQIEYKQKTIGGVVKVLIDRHFKLKRITEAANKVPPAPPSYEEVREKQIKKEESWGWLDEDRKKRDLKK